MLVPHSDKTLHAVLLHHGAVAVLHPASQRAGHGRMQVLIEPAQGNAPHCLLSMIRAAFQFIQYIPIYAIIAAERSEVTVD